MEYRVLLGDQPRVFLTDVDDKTERIIRNNLRKLTDDLYYRQGAQRLRK